jgi:hypothetical protein
VTLKDQATTTATEATGINGLLLMIAILAEEVAGQNPKLLAGLGPSLNNLIPTLRTSIGGHTHLQPN